MLSSGKAAVLKRYPFTIILKHSVEEPTLASLRLKLDPGSKTTGIALLNDQSGQIVFAAELEHRGHLIKDALLSRRGVRGSGGLTKFNRTQRGLPKTHWLDAACVGSSTPQAISAEGIRPWHIKSNGHGNRQMCSMDKHGFPRTGPKAAKRMKGYQTGDLVRAVVPPPRKTAGTHVGRVLARATGSFDITTKHRRVTGVSYQYCYPIHRSDGYSYTRGETSTGTRIAPTTEPA